MRAILKREMKSYFSGPIGYVCIAVLLALSGLLYWQIMYTGSSSYIYMVYSNMFTYCMMVIPIITMKSLSDEQRNKTDQALLTAPVSVTAIVLGKFLAAFIVYAIAMTGTLPVLWGRHDLHRRVYFQPDGAPGGCSYRHRWRFHLHPDDGADFLPGQRHLYRPGSGMAVL